MTTLLYIVGSQRVLVDHVKFNYQNVSTDCQITGSSDVTIRHSESTAILNNGDTLNYKCLYMNAGHGIVFEDNTFSASVTNSKTSVTGMDIFPKYLTEFSAHRNKFTIQCDKALTVPYNKCCKR